MQYRIWEISVFWSCSVWDGMQLLWYPDLRCNIEFSNGRGRTRNFPIGSDAFLHPGGSALNRNIPLQSRDKRHVNICRRSALKVQTSLAKGTCPCPLVTQQAGVTLNLYAY
jgi:hypothetical protein